MNDDSLWNALNSPPVRILLGAAMFLLLLWYIARQNKTTVRRFAASKGYSFEPTLEDGTGLHLEKTSFFRKGDVIRNVVRGELPDTTYKLVKLRGASFVLFEHETTRRENGDFTQTIVAFEVKPESSFRQTVQRADGVQMERAGNHVFLWMKQGRVPAQNLEQFLISAHQNFVFGSIYFAAMRK